MLNGNQKPKMEGQTIQRPDEKGQNGKQWSQNSKIKLNIEQRNTNPIKNRE